MTRRDDDFRIRPGRIRDAGASGRRATRFVAEVMRAARKAGHTGYRLGAASGSGAGFGRGRFARAPQGLIGSSRRVVVKARVVRHRGARYRSASLARHIAYLRRDGVGRDGQDAPLFNRAGDECDDRAFAAACEEDRHHFRFIISPEDAHRLEDLMAFTRDLMARAERDLGTRLDWIAVEHWDTDNPHVHVLVRGKADDGRDLVVALELGPRSAREIAGDLEAQVAAERWTDLDLALRALADDHAGVLDLRRGAPEPRDPELRRAMLGRAQTLERLGLAGRIAPAVWELKPGAEATLCELGLRGDIIKTMHRAMAGGPARPAADFAIEGAPAEPILGRLVARGFLDDEGGAAYAIVDGVDGRVHHLRFAELEATGDTAPGGVVETRRWTGRAGGAPRLALVGRSDLGLAAQIEADGATWLDRLQLARERAPLAGGGFGAEVREALDRRTDRLVAEGLAERRGGRVIFAPDLLATLRRRELDAAARLSVIEAAAVLMSVPPGQAGGRRRSTGAAGACGARRGRPVPEGLRPGQAAGRYRPARFGIS